MRQAVQWLACGLLALGAVGLAQPASAQSSALLEEGNFIKVGDAVITLMMCSSAVSSLCGPGTDVQFAAAPGPNVGFVIESDTNPGVTNFLSADDLFVVFSVATSSQAITSIGLSATGTGGASVGETVFDDGQGTNHSCQISSGSPSVGVGSTTSISLTYGQPGCSTNEQLVYVAKDLNANAGTISSVTQYVDAVGAPEPFSSAILVVGLVGLAAVRRRVCN